MAWLLKAVAAATGVFSAFFFLASLALLRRRFAKSKGKGGPAFGFFETESAKSKKIENRTPQDLPPVTILKPLRGTDPDLDENLESFCRQDYPSFQIVLTAQDPDDPALPAARRLQKKFPDIPIDVTVGSRPLGNNPKINNLAGGVPLARHDLWLISDSDVKVDEGFLKNAVIKLRREKLSLVSAFYLSTGASTAWERLEGLLLNAHFTPAAVVGAALGKPFAMGAAMLVDRPALERVGGLGAIADYLADDYRLALEIARARGRVGFADELVKTRNACPTLAHYWIRESRYFGTLRVCDPAGYAGLLFLQGFSILSLRIAFFGPDPVSLCLAAAILASRAAFLSAILGLGSGRRPSWRDYLLLPVGEWSSFGLWIAGFFARSVSWRGRRYKIVRGGRLEPVKEAAGTKTDGTFASSGFSLPPSSSKTAAA